ncbi:hypothetical protein QL285_015440 [Trifolium repens]|jgi:hypothetical protein|nr:hypothetical protein QL285_015440 [Trifolium repens]
MGDNQVNRDYHLRNATPNTQETRSTISSAWKNGYTTAQVKTEDRDSWNSSLPACSRCREEEWGMKGELRQLIAVSHKTQESLNKSIADCWIHHDAILKLQASIQVEGLLTRTIQMTMMEVEKIHKVVRGQEEIIKTLVHHVVQLTTSLDTLQRSTRPTYTRDECKMLKTTTPEEDEEELNEIKASFSSIGIECRITPEEHTEALEEYYNKVRFMQELVDMLNHHCSLKEKKQDPGSLVIDCYIGEAVVKALCDIGSSVNVMPLSLAKAFNLKEPTKGTARELTLADQSTIYSKGNIEDIQVRISDLEFPADFMILDVKEDKEHPIILGRPFLATARAIIDMGEGELTIRKDGETRIIQLFNTWNEECYKLEWKKKAEPKTPGKTWRIKVEVQELEEDMEQLTIGTGTIKEVPQDIEDKLKRLAIEVDVKAPWVTTWGKSRRVAKKTKPQLGVNTTQVKKKPVKEESNKKGAVGEAPREEDKRTYPTQ